MSTKQQCTQFILTAIGFEKLLVKQENLPIKTEVITQPSNSIENTTLKKSATADANNSAKKCTGVEFHVKIGEMRRKFRLMLQETTVASWHPTLS